MRETNKKIPATKIPKRTEKGMPSVHKKNDQSMISQMGMQKQARFQAALNLPAEPAKKTK